MLNNDFAKCKRVPEAIKHMRDLLKNDEKYKDWDINLMAEDAQRLLDEYLTLRYDIVKYFTICDIKGVDDKTSNRLKSDLLSKVNMYS